MKKFIGGLVLGIIVALCIGWIYLSINTLNIRVTGIEQFLNNAVKQGQQQQPLANSTKTGSNRKTQ